MPVALGNEKALAIAHAGLDKILDADGGVADDLNTTVVHMIIPLVQVVLRHVRLADPAVNGGTCTDGVCANDMACAEGSAFAAAVLPQIDGCDDKVVIVNLDAGSAGTPMSDGYRIANAQVETTCQCVDVACADIGAHQDNKGVFEGKGSLRN